MRDPLYQPVMWSDAASTPPSMCGCLTFHCMINRICVLTIFDTVLTCRILVGMHIKHVLYRFCTSQDKVVAETNLARNDLEAYVLDMRNRLSGDLYDYSTENERNTLNKGLDDMEAWLYEDGLDAQKSEYRNRLDQLKKIGDPITNRKQEADRRPETISSLQQTIQHFREWAKSTTDPKYSHISAEDRKKVSDYAEQAATWLDGANASFASLKPTDNPIYTNQQLLQKKYDVEKFAHPIVCKPAPKPTATPPPKSAQPGAKPAGTDSKSSTPAPGQQETKESEVKQEDTPMEQ